ncbi:acetyl-CoA carboxylase biotin carboxyl carrier protein [Phycisphaera mikurensis]|uniref:Biotin carboxyl carrier protein of acetyl-CoA carboxylase n=1 Tax=Phycisphaera mikurensis (strain NBRC 102666 / KCTC 22515 / FYK2301M01) TaxID=1142394 RepID=I0IG75_PHYMF|nr:acetyl-CoA carboxylase biotin carboxyl carrier protein [Phycisphaera mikurensis]MBB6440354.1 acetyl-CoA carboxylase biotin carboxyl carrier protein [Phycisphaera mikurensis]BAM04263.1 acetyl-CoA carboxylase biotin carboxyl carrier protein [Phycisphaera mikurensis NBRC 102666]
MTDLKILRQLIKMMVDNGLSEVDLEDQGEKIKLKRGGGGEVVQHVPAPPPAASAATGAGAAAAAPAASGPAADDDAEGTPVVSPMVGSFYAASSPDADDFVKVGDRVTPDTVVCIIEAMKVFNEIKAEASGTVAEIKVSNGDAVEFGQVLFVLK